VDWNDTTRFYVLAGYVLGIATRLGVPLRWGGDWNGNWSYRDQRFHDLGHLELEAE
jgi:peptidoglycan L-alanyl-D-glutamate endopeptidase CwlK